MNGEILGALNVSLVCSFIPMQMQLSHKKQTDFNFLNSKMCFCFFRAFLTKISKLLMQINQTL